MIPAIAFLLGVIVGAAATIGFAVFCNLDACDEADTLPTEERD